MSVEENVHLMESLAATVNARDWDRLRGFYAESVVLHVPDSAEPLRGPDAIIERLQSLDHAFPDFRSEKVRVFGAGDWISSETVVNATHKGSLEGPGGDEIPATNRPIRMPIVSVVRIEGGKIAEAHQYYDQLGMMAQLGLTP